jgi:hypothetical protein
MGGTLAQLRVSNTRDAHVARGMYFVFIFACYF